MRSLIIYYSNSGTTKDLAKKIQKKFQSKMVSIEPKEAYGAYISAVKRSGYERKNNIVPEYDAPKINLENVDIVFVGYPIWYSEAPSIVLDYLSKMDLKGKIVIPFSTSGATNIKTTLKSLKKVVGEAEIKLPYNQGKVFKTNFDNWVEEVNKAY